MRGDTRCIDGRLWRHDPQPDDPYLETERGECPECRGKGCCEQGHVYEVTDSGIGKCTFCGKQEPERDELPNCVWRNAATPFARNH